MRLHTIGEASTTDKFHEMTKSEYESYTKSLTPKPNARFKIGNITVIQNPTRDDYYTFSKRVRNEFPNMPPDTPKIRSTHDKKGNTWIWMAHEALHMHIEPEIERITGEKVNQNYEIPRHSEHIKDAIRNKTQIPSQVRAEYPQYAEFWNSYYSP